MLALRGLQAPWLISQTFSELMVMLKHRNSLIWLKKQFCQQNRRQILCNLEEREEKALNTTAALPTDSGRLQGAASTLETKCLYPLSLFVA